LLRCWQSERGIIIDPITITGIAALDAALVGAGVGAATSAATGSDPLKGALLGGAMGGGGSLLGFGGGAAGGASEGIKDISTMATPLETTLGSASEQLVPNAFGGASIDLGNLGYNATEGANLLGSMGTGITQTANPLMSMGAGGELVSGMPTFMDKFSSMPNSVVDFMKTNPGVVMTGGLAAYDRSQPTPIQSQSGGARKGQAGQYEPILNIEIPKQKYKHSLLG
jgi:hypothetical protein